MTNMRKINLIGLTLLAVFAFVAITASAAFAESEWLVDGLPIAAKVAFDMEGSLLFSDLSTSFGSAEILCSEIFDGWLEPAGKGEVTKILTLSKVEISSEGGAAPLVCSGEKLCGETLRWMANLPWLIVIALMPGLGELEWLLLFIEEAAKTPAYEQECTILGIKVKDLCEGPTSFWLLNMPAEVPADVLGFASEANLDEESLLATCTLGGAQSGGLETEEENGTFGGGLILTVPTLELAVS